jgi:hypothetical protein
MTYSSNFVIDFLTILCFNQAVKTTILYKKKASFNENYH